MTRIITTAPALPGHQCTQQDVRAAMYRWANEHLDNVDRVMKLFDHAGVGTRYTVMPLEDLFAERSFGERNQSYIEHAVELAERASVDALAAAGLPSEAVDLITTVSCTGFMIPAVDAHLANRLPLKRMIRRLPITELGCAAGAMAMSHTADYLKAYPEQQALLTAVELPSLCFQRSDFSMDHLVSCALFGDGAAAVTLAGEDSPLAARYPAAPRIAHRTTWFMHDTLDAMGFRVADTGFHMVLDRRIPDLLEEHLMPALQSFLASAGLQLDDVDHFLIHPGGRKILDKTEAMLGRGPDAVHYSRQVLERYGNLSSASVLLLLHEFLQDDVARPGERGVVVAFGPGFNAELILLEWPQSPRS